MTSSTTTQIPGYVVGTWDIDAATPPSASPSVT